MLGKNFEVIIDGQAYGRNSRSGAPLYCAHVSNQDSPLYRKKVYVISNRDVGTHLYGKVIAVANKGMGSRERVVMAPLNSIYYSPEIRCRLSRIRNIGPYKLYCLYEKSCGAVIYKVEGNERKYLLVKNRNAKHWGFPKGHIEIGESEKETAKREVKEETGLDITILDGFRKTGVYRPFGKIKKLVVIFVGKAKNGKVKVQNSEIEGYKWLNYKDAVACLWHNNDLRIFNAAHAWVNKNEI